VNIAVARFAFERLTTGTSRTPFCCVLFKVVGMNSIFIYLFFEIVGDRWFNAYVGSIVRGLLKFTGIALSWQNILSCLCIFALEWGLCYFLYRKKIFFRL